MTVKELYETIHGSYQKALNMMIMDEFIKKMLTKFVQSDPAASLFKAYENRDYPAVFAAGHSLKGVAGNLALESLFDRIVPIVEKTRNCTPGSIVDIDNEMNVFRNEYELVMIELKSFLNL